MVFFEKIYLFTIIVSIPEAGGAPGAGRLPGEIPAGPPPSWFVSRECFREVLGGPTFSPVDGWRKNWEKMTKKKRGGKWMDIEKMKSESNYKSKSGPLNSGGFFPILLP